MSLFVKNTKTRFNEPFVTQFVAIIQIIIIYEQVDGNGFKFEIRSRIEYLISIGVNAKILRYLYTYKNIIALSANPFSSTFHKFHNFNLPLLFKLTNSLKREIIEISQSNILHRTFFNYFGFLTLLEHFL